MSAGLEVKKIVTTHLVDGFRFYYEEYRTSYFIAEGNCIRYAAKGIEGRNDFPDGISAERIMKKWLEWCGVSVK